MPETVTEEEVRDDSYEELIEGLEESLRQAAEGRVYRDNDAIRKRIEELREQS